MAARRTAYPAREGPWVTPGRGGSPSSASAGSGPPSKVRARRPLRCPRTRVWLTPMFDRLRRLAHAHRGL
eukprot:6950826-Prymnesium_polylepis.1